MHTEACQCNSAVHVCDSCIQTYIHRYACGERRLYAVHNGKWTGHCWNCWNLVEKYALAWGFKMHSSASAANAVHFAESIAGARARWGILPPPSRYKPPTHFPTHIYTYTKKQLQHFGKSLCCVGRSQPSRSLTPPALNGPKACVGARQL